jgi:hypothetical protein
MPSLILKEQTQPGELPSVRQQQQPHWHLPDTALKILANADKVHGIHFAVLQNQQRTFFAIGPGAIHHGQSRCPKLLPAQE